MSDAAATSWTSHDSLGRTAAALTPDAIDAILADFRTWLTDLANVGADADGLRAADAVDLFALVGQFAALRHEVNMQTRAARTAVEQNAEVLKHLEALQSEAKPDAGSDELRAVAKALLDVTDALTLSLRHMEKLRESAEPLLVDLTVEDAPPPSPGFFARLFGRRSMPEPEANDEAAFAREKLDQLVAAAADGYAMSLRRVERLLPTLELEPLACLGEDFDPETMEAVEVVDGGEYPPGTVVEEVRPGYLWRGKVFRFAQVKVAR